MLRYPLVSCRYPVFSVNACIYSTLRPFLCQHLGALPQTPTSLAAPRGRRLKPNHLTLWRKCWVGSKASRVKCTASPPLTPLHLRESSKTIRSGWSWKPVKACRSNRLLGLYRLEATQRSVVRVQEVSPAPLPRGEHRGCGQRPRCWQDPWGRAVGFLVCRRHSFKGFGG